MLARRLLHTSTRKMTITEFLWPVFKSDAESLAALKQLNIGQSLGSFKGVQYAYSGRILEVDGLPNDNPGKSVSALEWDKEESFHALYPNSDQFKEFIGKIKPYAAAPAVPELFKPVEGDSRSVLDSAVTQIIRSSSTGSAFGGAWDELVKSINANTNQQIKSYRASGVGKDEGTCAGVIGWASKEDYEKVGKSEGVLEQIKRLGEVKNVVAEFQKV